MPTGFHHVAVQAQDVEKVAAFYRDVLGLPERARHLFADGTLRSVWIQVSPEGAFIAVEHLREGTRGTLGHSMLALRIDRDERELWLGRLAAAGVAIEKQSRWTVYVKDPEGNIVGLSHHPHDPLGI